MADSEIEFKYLLSEESMRTLTEALGSRFRERLLSNRYYTVRPEPDRRDWVLRLRTEGSSRELTLKIGREVEPGLFVSTEYTEKVAGEEPESWEKSEPMVRFRSELSTARLVLLGESRTCRRVYAAPTGCGRQWELDVTELPNGVVFRELEVEVEEPSGFDLMYWRRKLESWLETSKVVASPSEKTKYARFLEAVNSGSPD